MEQNTSVIENANFTDQKIGVITADIVGSTKIPIELRKPLLDSLHQLEQQLQSVVPFRMEIYRGDSFQIVVDDYGKVALLAVLIRAGLRKMAPAGQLWDARLSIGIGKTSYVDTQISASDGEAFRYAGKGLDALGKKDWSSRPPRKKSMPNWRFLLLSPMIPSHIGHKNKVPVCSTICCLGLIKNNWSFR